jgi:hypothetical protein
VVSEGGFNCNFLLETMGSQGFPADKRAVSLPLCSVSVLKSNHSFIKEIINVPLRMFGLE